MKSVCTIYIYIYMVTPPPMIHLQAFYMGITSVLCTFFFTRKMTFSCFYFLYLLRKSPTQTHTHTCNFVFVYFFVISWGFGQKPKKHWENQKNQKNQNCKTHVGTSWWVRVCNFVFGFFGFLEVFNTFGQKPKKHWENQKKQNCKTHVGTSWWVRVCNFVFLFFLDFSRFLILLVKNPKNIEKTK